MWPPYAFTQVMLNRTLPLRSKWGTQLRCFSFQIFEIACTELLNCDCLGVWGFLHMLVFIGTYQFGIWHQLHSDCGMPEFRMRWHTPYILSMELIVAQSCSMLGRPWNRNKAVAMDIPKSVNELVVVGFLSCNRHLWPGSANIQQNARNVNWNCKLNRQNYRAGFSAGHPGVTHVLLDQPSATYYGKYRSPEPGSVTRFAILDELVADGAAADVGWKLHHVRPWRAWENWPLPSTLSHSAGDHQPYDLLVQISVGLAVIHPSEAGAAEKAAPQVEMEGLVLPHFSLDPPELCPFLVGS